MVHPITSPFSVRITVIFLLPSRSSTSVKHSQDKDQGHPVIDIPIAGNSMWGLLSLKTSFISIIHISCTITNNAFSTSGRPYHFNKIRYYCDGSMFVCYLDSIIFNIFHFKSHFRPRIPLCSTHLVQNCSYLDVYRQILPLWNPHFYEVWFYYYAPPLLTILN